MNNMLTLLAYYDERVVGKFDDQMHLVEKRRREERSLAAYNGYFVDDGCGAALASVYSKASMSVEGFDAPDFSSECIVYAGGRTYSADEVGFDSIFCGGLIFRKFVIKYSSRVVFEYSYKRNWLHELLRGSEDYGYGYHDFFDYLVNHAVKARRRMITAERRMS